MGFFSECREFNSPVVIGVVKSKRMHYVEHMIRGTEDPPQRVPYRAVPEGRQNQSRLKSRRVDGVKSWL
jgi:hypothetical protein